MEINKGQSRDQWIQLRAHQIWESEGRPHGRYQEHWLRAEQDYSHEASTAEGAAKTAGDLVKADQSANASATPSIGSTPVETVEAKREANEKSKANRGSTRGSGKTKSQHVSRLALGRRDRLPGRRGNIAKPLSAPKKRP